jgi:hypothetical protein
MAIIGLSLLACTMAAAVLIVIFVAGNAASSIFPGVFLIALAVIAWNQRRGSKNFPS